jgi:hypothetical protein
MKTAYELAMERLKKKDEDAGIQTRPISDAQKAQIAEIRNFYEAKIAEGRVLYESKMRLSVDPGERDTLEREFRHDRERLESERDRKIQKIRDAG